MMIDHPYRSLSDGADAPSGLRTPRRHATTRSVATVPDNVSMLFRKHLAMFGPGEVVLTSDELVVKQFSDGRRIGPIVTSEQNNESMMAEQQTMIGAGHHDGGTEESSACPGRSMQHRGCRNARPSGVRRPGYANHTHRARGQTGSHPRRRRRQQPAPLLQPRRRRHRQTPCEH